jgi:hypothetical protein
MGYARLIIFTCFIAVAFCNSTTTSLNKRDIKLDEALTVALADAILNFEGGTMEEQYLPAASEIRELQPNSPEINDLRFHAQLCHTVNCRDSLNNWDCDECLKVLPDSEVLNYFKTAPNDIVGQIIRSKAYVICVKLKRKGILALRTNGIFISKGSRLYLFKLEELHQELTRYWYVLS